MEVLESLFKVDPFVKTVFFGSSDSCILLPVLVIFGKWV